MTRTDWAVLMVKRKGLRWTSIGAVAGAFLGGIGSSAHVGPDDLLWTTGMGSTHTTSLGVIVFVIGGSLFGGFAGSVLGMLDRK